jgi:hypothetical protein
MAILAADAPFSKSPVLGAKAHADKHGFKVVSDARYPLSATELAPFISEVQYQGIKGADLSDFRDARTQAVVWPSSLASGALIYPYAKAKRSA